MRIFTFLGEYQIYSWSVLKTSEFSQVRSASENFDVFNSRDDILLAFTVKKVNFLLTLYFLEDSRLIYG